MNYLQKKLEARKYYKVLKTGKKMKYVASLYNVEASYIFDLLKQYYPFMELNEILLYDENTEAKKLLTNMLIEQYNIVLYGDSAIDKFAIVKDVAKQLNFLVDTYTMCSLRNSAELLSKMNNSHKAPPLDIYKGKIIVLRDLKKFDWRGFRNILVEVLPSISIVIITDDINYIDQVKREMFELLEVRSITFSTEYEYVHEPWNVAKALINSVDREECHQMLKTAKGNWWKILYYLRAGIHQITEPTLRKYNYDVVCFVEKNKHNMNRELLIYYLAHGLIPSSKKISWLKPYYFGKKQIKKEYKKSKAKKPKVKKKKPQKTLEVYL